MTWAIEVDRDELEQVVAFLGPCPPVETQQHGVWVTHANGRRSWECDSRPIVWRVTCPAPTASIAAAGLQPVCLPGRLVWHAAELARDSLSGTVRISVPDEWAAIVESDAGTAAVDLPVDPARRRVPDYVQMEARVKVTAGEALDLLVRTTLPPIGLADDQRPLVTLAAIDGRLATSIDWSEQDGLRSTYTIAAAVTGGGKCLVPPDAFIHLLQAFERDDEIIIGLPLDQRMPLLVDAPGRCASLQRRPCGAERYRDEVGQALADASGEGARIVDHLLVTDYRGWRIEVELRDLPAETICVSTVLCTDVPESIDLWRQVNAMNAQLVRARVWMDDFGYVRAGFDLPCTAIGALRSELATFHAQLDGFGVFASAFAAGEEDGYDDGFDEDCLDDLWDDDLGDDDLGEVA